MRTLEEEREQARELGLQINREARRNPNSPYAGKVVGTLRGKVAIVANTLDEVAVGLSGAPRTRCTAPLLHRRERGLRRPIHDLDARRMPRVT